MRTIQAHLDYAARSISLFLSETTGTALRVPEPLVMRDADPGEFAEPFVRIDRSEAQELMDSLWQCGIRPTEGTGSAGSLAATQKHLEDMRTIAFRALGMN